MKSVLMTSNAYYQNVGGIENSLQYLARSYVDLGRSHKYEYFFLAMGFAEGLIDIQIDKDALYERLRLIIDPVRRGDVVTRLHDHAAIRRHQANQLFAEVNACLGQV